MNLRRGRLLRNHSIRAVFTISALAVLIGYGLLPVAQAQAVTDPGPSVNSSTAPGESAAAAVADAVRTTATRDFPSIYVGLILTDNGTKVVVYMTQLTPEAESTIAAGMPAGSIGFAQAPRSLSFLNNLHQHVISAHDSLASQGISVVSNGPNMVTGKEDITVQNLTAAKTATLGKLLGSNNLVLTTTTADHTAIAVDRNNDTPPFNGGDFIFNNPVTGGCTSGFGATEGAVSYEITAGHCYATGDVVITGDPSLSGTFYEMGTVTTRGNFGVSGGNDAEVIDTTSFGGSSNLLYTGPVTGAQRALVSGALTSPQGDQVCQDGAWDDEICGLVIQNPASMCITENDNGTNIYICNVYQANNTSGGVAVGAGDSGGPVFRFIGSSLYAVGIVTAEGGTQTACAAQYPPYFTGRQCGSVLYYTDINSILSEFGASLNK